MNCVYVTEARRLIAYEIWFNHPCRNIYSDHLPRNGGDKRWVGMEVFKVKIQQTN